MIIHAFCVIIFRCATMAKLADAIDLGSIVNDVGVQVPLTAPNQYNPNQILVTSEWFGFTFTL